MSEWRENSNGNYVYILDSDELMRALEDLGYALGIMSGPKTPGRKPYK